MSKAVVVIGAGAGGLSAAIRLAARGYDVVVIERQSAAGGKLRPEIIDGHAFDTGPTVLTMRWVFDELFADAGVTQPDELRLDRLDVLARHFWTGGTQLDLFASQKVTEDAIGVMAGRDNLRGYQRFTVDSKGIYDTLRDTFLQKQRPTPLCLAASMPLTRLMSINPMETMWRALGRYFTEPRLMQLFGRYATYCGSSPFKSPATLMLIAAVEAEGVWRIHGGMRALATTFEHVARQLGVKFNFDCQAKTIETQNSSISAVIDSMDNRHACSAVILNADSEAAAAGLFGDRLKAIAEKSSSSQRSLSAVTWCVTAKSAGPGLQHHNVFFSEDYAKEFAALEYGPAEDPTVYLCDQGDARSLILINAPANAQPASSQTDAHMLRRLARCGVELDWPESAKLRRDPKIFAELYPGTSGALYGRSAHGWMSTFQRPRARTSIPGLYLAGGYTHPGPGVPMAVLSGKLAAEAMMQDRASMQPFRKTAIAGGILMP